MTAWMMTPPPKAFDAIHASRQWRENTSRKLDAMRREERLAHYARLMKQAMGAETTGSSGKTMKA
jgi:hypothetical protein